MPEPSKPFRKPGRPEMQEGKKTCFIRARLTEDEYLLLLEMEKQLGLNHTELIRRKVLGNADQTLLNARQVLKQLDRIGAELGRSGNNVNQLARHANTLNRQGRLDPGVIEEFNKLFASYLLVRQETEDAMRRLIRLIRA